jgi:hypothetical protein
MYIFTRLITVHRHWGKQVAGQWAETNYETALYQLYVICYNGDKQPS